MFQMLSYNTAQSLNALEFKYVSQPPQCVTVRMTFSWCAAGMKLHHSHAR